jgi:hypothetical protein
MTTSNAKPATGAKKKAAPKKAATKKTATRKPAAASAAATRAAPVAAIDRGQVAELAYALWQARGCPDGQDEQIWLEAEQQLLTGSRRP